MKRDFCPYLPVTQLSTVPRDRPGLATSITYISYLYKPVACLKGQQEPAQKVSASKAPAATLAVVCSPAGEPRREWRTRKDEGLAETGGQWKTSEARLAHQDKEIKQARSGHSTESQQEIAGLVALYRLQLLPVLAVR